MTHQTTVRLVLAVSLDGRLAFPQGGASHLGGSGDRRALEEALTWSDAVLIGAGTVRAHRSSCLIHARDLLEQRQSTGRPQQPALFVVARDVEFPQHWPLFQQPLARYLLSPGGGGAKGFLEGFPLAASWTETLSSLAARGWSRVVLLGGAGLCASMLADDARPSRLERAKAEVSDLLSYLSDDHVGLIAFAGMTMVAGWVLYRYLIKIPSMDQRYASI